MNDSGILNTYSNRRNDVFHRHQGSKTIVPEEPSQEDIEDYGEEEESYQQENTNVNLKGKGERQTNAKDIKSIKVDDSLMMDSRNQSIHSQNPDDRLQILNEAGEYLF